MGEEVRPLDVPLLVGVQGGELQGGCFLLRLPHGLLKLLLVHQVLVVQEVVQRQAGVCGGRFGASLPPAFPLGAPCIPPTTPASLTATGDPRLVPLAELFTFCWSGQQ